MADVSELNGLTIAQLVELAGQTGIQVDSGAKRDDIAATVAAGVSPEAVKEYRAELEAQAPQQPRAALKYYRTNIAGLSVVVGQAEDQYASPETVRFIPILQRWDGDMQKFGYLATDNAEAIKKLNADHRVVSIDKSEFDGIMERADDDDAPNVKRTGY